MQISVLFAYCSGRNFNDGDLPLISKYGTRLILGCVIGPRGHEYLMSLRITLQKQRKIFRLKYLLCWHSFVPVFCRG